MNIKGPRLALKVDCDTYEGTRNGLPRLLRLFDRFKIRATFFFTVGPDTSGRAVARVFTQKGFLKKMLRSNALSLYGPKTMLYGTLLPAPLIGKRCRDEIKAVHTAGHETGVHAWDHIRWHSALHRMTESQIEHDYNRAHDTFEEIIGRRARSSAAPGWHATFRSLKIQEQRHLLYASDTRGGTPFFPVAEGTRFTTLEIPSTLPTWDEVLGSPEFKEKSRLLSFYETSLSGTDVHSIHTEVEGSALIELFAEQLQAWIKGGVTFVTLEELAREALEHRDKIPFRMIHRKSIPGRAGEITSSV